jgi:hypothetical protein
LAREYGSTRYSHSTATKLIGLLAVLKVDVNDDDTITISTPTASRRYVEIEPFVFRELDGIRTVVFQEDENGRIRYMFPADAPPVSTIGHSWYELSDVQLGLVVGSLGIFASALLFWPALAFTVRGLQSPRIKRTWFSALLSNVAWFKVLLTTTQISAGLTAIVVLGCLIAWMKGYWRLTGRLHYTLVALAGIGFTWFLYNWNLLTFGFNGIVN